MTPGQRETIQAEFEAALRARYGAVETRRAVKDRAGELWALLQDTGFDTERAVDDAADLMAQSTLESGPERWRLYIADVQGWFAAPRSQRDQEKGWFGETEGGWLLPSWSRARVWDALGLSAPLEPGTVGRWLHAREAAQEHAGDRLTLHLPQTEVAPAPRSRLRAATAEEQQEAANEHAGGDFWAYQSARKNRVQAYSGRYDERDLADPMWDGTYSFGTSTAPLFQLALGVRALQQQTRCAPQDALMFYLADVRFEAPYLSIRSDAPGYSIWFADRQTDPRDIAAVYRSFRNATRPRRTRARRERTAEMVAFVDRARRENPRVPWAVLEASWNHERRADWHYEPGSMKSAYSRAKKLDKSREAQHD